MDFNAELFVKTLKVERAKRGWSQEDLAKASNTSLSSVKKYEAGKVCPSIEAVFKIASALGMSIDELVSLPKVEKRETA